MIKMNKSNDELNFDDEPHLFYHWQVRLKNLNQQYFRQ